MNILTEYITIDGNRPEEEIFDKLGRAAEVIKEGGLVVFPTETVYGLGADALNPDAAKKIYAAKGRPSDNPLIVHIADYDSMLAIADMLPIQAKQLADTFWPGPLTMIVKKNHIVPDETTGGLPTVAVRMPNDPRALALIRRSGCYIAAPSANISGRPSPTRFSHVKEDMDGRADVIINGGDVPIGIESTIIDLSVDVPMILRPGYITAEQIADVIGEVKTDPGLVLKSNEAPKAPGMKYRHYAPKGKLSVVEGEAKTVIAYINAHAKQEEAAGKRVGVIAANETAEAYKVGLVLDIGSREDEDAIAADFYACLRRMDDEKIDVIFSESLKTPRLGNALMNRLLKAAGGNVIDADRKDDVGSGRNTKIRRVIFACGNGITRAPMAAALFREMYKGEDIEAISRGLIVGFPEPLNQKTEAVMISNGIEWEDYTAKELEDAEITENIYVIVMNEKEKRRVIEKYPSANEENTFVFSSLVGDELEIIDPYGGSLQTYGICFEVIRSSVEKLIQLL